MTLLQYAMLIDDLAETHGFSRDHYTTPPAPPQAKTPADLRALEAARLKRERRAAKARAGR